MQEQERQRPKQFIDMKMPLTWLLSSATTIMITLGVTLWNIAQQSYKLDQLILANTKIEKRLDDRDARIDILRDKISSLENQVNTIIIRLDDKRK